MNNKVPQQINDIVGDNVKKLAQLFPSAVKDGAVDFEALKEELGQFEEVGSEKYELTWAGKKNAKKIAQEDVIGRTLKFIPEDSKDADTTENLYIEGDNLEVLKLLRQNYYGAIKMIYIDPPYNTGNDFVYNDSFVMSQEESDVAEKAVDELGERYTVNKNSQNRYHANWLNMMYPRLKIAKDLLCDNGVIFISIDDNEFDNLTKVCDEIFEPDNKIGPIIQNKLNAKNDTVDIQKNHEYIVIYRKQRIEKGDTVQATLSREVAMYRDVFEENGRYYYINDAITTRGEGGTLNARPNLGYTVYYNPVTKEKIGVVDYDIEQAKISNDEKLIYTDRTDLIEQGYIAIRPPKVRGNLGCWTWAVEKFNHESDNIIITGKEGKYAVKKRTFINKDEVVLLHGKFQYISHSMVNSKSIIDFSTNEGTNALSELIKKKGIFNNPKNIEMIKYFLDIINDKNCIVLDFFSGSSSTADAIMQLNADDSGHRKFVMIQLPEECEKKSDAYKEGYKNICEVGKERIRRAGNKIKSEHPNADIDVGFKVFRAADTNIKWNSLMDMGQIDINQMETSPDTIDFVPGAKDVDIVYELMLRQNDVPLSSKIEQIFGGGYERTYLYADSYLVCLETKITNELIDKLAELDPLPIKFIFRDSAFQDDIALKDETFRRLKALIEKNHGLQKTTYTVEFL